MLSEAHPLARLVARCALERTESRGAHIRVDYPERDPALDHRHVVLTGGEPGAWQHWTERRSAKARLSGAKPKKLADLSLCPNLPA